MNDDDESNVTKFPTVTGAELEDLKAEGVEVIGEFFFIDPMQDDDSSAMPDAEVFFRPKALQQNANPDAYRDEEGKLLSPGWYWWPNKMGGLPDGSAHGPFISKLTAILDGQSKYRELEDQGKI